ncbi:MAG: c-type cytochrome [Leptospira sp.]|nr:c-type cytochrome [Leptospira sp.]
MSSQDHNKEFDGIRQGDNPIPPRWKLFFLISIVFAIGYAVYFHNFSDWKMEDRFAIEAKEHDAKFPKAKEVASTDGSNPLRGNADAIAQGKATFGGICAACHGPEAKGVIGPDLTDKVWIHGNTDSEVFALINAGIGPEKAKLKKGIMPPHNYLGSEKIYQVMAWLASNNPTLIQSKK